MTKSNEPTAAHQGFKVVIPARHASTRLPGKPLLEIAGRPMIQHVWERARASAAQEVIVATDDGRIAAACRGFGAEVVETRADHHSGSDRVCEVIQRRGWDPQAIVVNLQGDEPCMPPALIDQVADGLAKHPGIGVSTLAYPIAEAQTLFDPHVVKVVVDAQGLALYFSRAPIPWHRDAFQGGRAKLPRGVKFLRHIGLYAYRAGFLARYISWPPAALEITESLEQLRILWHGEDIHVGIAAVPPGQGVDTAEDLQRVSELMGKTG